MLLRHGTKCQLLPAILRDGIIPRAIGSGNWPEVQTRSDLVYLTRHLGHVYAKQAARNGGTWLIVEVNADLLDEGTFLPDEDFMATEMAHHPREVALRILANIRANLEKYRDAYLNRSLREMGNVAVKAIVPSRAITRYCLIDVSQRIQLAEYIMPSTQMEFPNWLQMNERITMWLFGDCATLPNIPGVSATDLDRESRDRTGIAVVQVTNH